MRRGEWTDEEKTDKERERDRKKRGMTEKQLKL